MFASFCSTEQPAAAAAMAAVTFRWNSHATDPIPPRRQEKTQISTDAFQIFLVKRNAPNVQGMQSAQQVCVPRCILYADAEINTTKRSFKIRFERKPPFLYK
jgi:hypothetical protein